MGASSPPLRDFCCSLVLGEGVLLPWDPQQVRRFREESRRASRGGWKPVKELLVVGRLSGREKAGRYELGERCMQRAEVAGPCLSPWERGEPPDLQSYAGSVDLKVSFLPSLFPPHSRENSRVYPFSPPGSIGCISRFIWTFQCFTLVLAWRNFRRAACWGRVSGEWARDTKTGCLDLFNFTGPLKSEKAIDHLLIYVHKELCKYRVGIQFQGTHRPPHKGQKIIIIIVSIY